MIVREDKFQIKSIAKDTLDGKRINVSFTPPNDDDALSLGASFSNNLGNNSNFGNLGLDRHTNEFNRIIQDCRITSLHPLVKKILDHIETEAFPVSSDVTGRSSKINVRIDLEDLEDLIPEDIIEEIETSFKKSQKLLRFKVHGAKKFRNWYIDGRQAYHVIPSDNPTEGIVELREIDVLNLKKIRTEVKEKIDGIDVITDYETKYIFNPTTNPNIDYMSNVPSPELIIDESSIIYITSGLLNETKIRTVSHLEALNKVVENLNKIEDAQIIRYISDSTRTRVFYVDVGVHASMRAEKHIHQIQSKLKHNVEYDTKTGRLRDNRRFLSVLNDIFIPRISGSGQTTEIKTLPSDDNIDKIKSLEYTRNDLIEKSIVPKQRMTASQSFSMGKSNELSREETVFHKQIEGLRQRYSDLFHEIIKKDLIIKNVMTGEDYEELRDEIYFIFPSDNHYKMMMDFEVLDEKVARIQAIGHDPRIFYPIDEVANKICGYSDDEMKAIMAKYKDDLLQVQDIEMDRQKLEFDRTKEIDPTAFEEE